METILAVIGSFLLKYLADRYFSPGVKREVNGVVQGIINETLEREYEFKRNSDGSYTANWSFFQKD
jgi:hypothetical protein